METMTETHSTGSDSRTESEKQVTILVVEDDPGHAALIERNLRRAGIGNRMILFQDGQGIVDFLFEHEHGARRGEESYILLLDIRLPKIDGVEVLRRIKANEELRKIPVIMLTTTDDPREIERCHSLGCSHYIRKPVEYEHFLSVLRQLGLFLLVVEVPSVRRGLERSQGSPEG